MSLSIFGNASALAPYCSAAFIGAGGTPPYTYSVQGGGAGGTIDPSSGIYTAPGFLGNAVVAADDTIIVTDSLSATASLSVTIEIPLLLLCDIIASEMGLDPTQVYLYNQKYNIPIDDKLYIAIGIEKTKVFGNGISYSGDSNPNSALSANQSVNVMASLSVNILSRTIEALNRKEELVAALTSVYSLSQQNTNNFHIGKVPKDIQNLSEIDGDAIPYRFHFSINMQYVYLKSDNTASFNDLSFTTLVKP